LGRARACAPRSGRARAGGTLARAASHAGWHLPVLRGCHRVCARRSSLRGTKLTALHRARRRLAGSCRRGGQTRAAIGVSKEGSHAGTRFFLPPAPQRQAQEAAPVQPAAGEAVVAARARASVLAARAPSASHARMEGRSATRHRRWSASRPREQTYAAVRAPHVASVAGSAAALPWLDVRVPLLQPCAQALCERAQAQGADSALSSARASVTWRRAHVHARERAGCAHVQCVRSLHVGVVCAGVSACSDNSDTRLAAQTDTWC
jgi:hypothetical protein